MTSTTHLFQRMLQTSGSLTAKELKELEEKQNELIDELVKLGSVNLGYKQQIARLRTIEYDDLVYTKKELDKRISEMPFAKRKPYADLAHYLDKEIKRKPIYQLLTQQDNFKPEKILKLYLKANAKERDLYLRRTPMVDPQHETLTMLSALEKKAKRTFSFGRPSKTEQELARLSNSQVLIDIRTKSFSDMNAESQNNLAIVFKRGGLQIQDTILANQTIADLKKLLEKPQFKGNRMIKKHLQGQEDRMKQLSQTEMFTLTGEISPVFLEKFKKLAPKDQIQFLLTRTYSEIDKFEKKLNAEEYPDIKAIMPEYHRQFPQKQLEKSPNELIKEDMEQLRDLLRPPPDTALLRSLAALQETEIDYRFDITPIVTGPDKGKYQVQIQGDDHHRAIIVEEKTLIERSAKAIYETMDRMERQDGREHARSFIKLPKFAQEQLLISLDKDQLSRLKKNLESLKETIKGLQPARKEKLASDIIGSMKFVEENMQARSVSTPRPR